MGRRYVRKSSPQQGMMLPGARAVMGAQRYSERPSSSQRAPQCTARLECVSFNIELLPDAAAAPACTAFSHSLGLRPVGTAVRADLIVAIDAPLPWPKPVGKHDLLEPLNPLVRKQPLPLRIFASEPATSEPAVHFFAIGPTGTRYLRCPISDQIEIVDTVESVVGDLDGQHDWDICEDTWLVCTQGSHDVCCGTEGVTFANSLEGSGARVLRVSHTGGHRFAPTALHLPSGRMWAWLDAELAARIARSQVTAADLAAYGRGWCGANTGWAQAAEQAVRAQVGPVFDTWARTVEVEQRGEREAVCRVRAEDPSAASSMAISTEWKVTVVIERFVPSVSCSVPGGLPAKPGREFGITKIEDAAHNV